MRSPFKHGLIFAIALIACAQAALIVSCAAQEGAAYYPVRGVVLNSLTRRPIPRALVDGHTDAVLTDGDGRFELNLSQGISQLAVRRPGFNSTSRSAGRAVKVGPNMPDLTFYLTPEATITGHVTLSNGDEADGIRFLVFHKRTVNGHDSISMQGAVATNSDGVFQIGDLEAPASYLLCSRPSQDRNGAIAPGATGFGYPSVCYPRAPTGGADFSSASLLHLTPGQQAQADITLTRQPFYPVTISVPNQPQGRGGAVQIHDPSGRVLDFTARWNAQQGTAQVNLPNGQYYAEARTGGETPTHGRVDFRVANRPVMGLTMTMLPLHPITVHVHKDFTATGNNERQLIFKAEGQSGPDPGLNFMLESADEFNQGGSFGGLRQVVGSSDNTLFQTEHMAPGRYWVRIFPFEGYVSSVTCGGVDLAREPLIVGPGSTASPIEIALRDDSGQISGTINPSSTTTAGAQSADASVAFIYPIPLFLTTVQIQQAVAVDQGQFITASLVPGSYKVIALDEEIDSDAAQELAQSTGKGRTVTVEAGGTVSVQLDLIQVAAQAVAKESSQ